SMRSPTSDRAAARLTEDELTALEKLLKRATPGPWEASMTDADVDASPELQAALQRLVTATINGRPGEYAEAYADVLDLVPELAGTDWAQRFREAKYDSDRLIQLLDEFKASYPAP